MDITKFCVELNLEELDDSVTNLETFLKSYNDKLENTVNTMVPERQSRSYPGTHDHGMMKLLVIRKDLYIEG